MSDATPTTYTTKMGDRLDSLCVAQYGAASGYLEAVLAANPGLAAKGEIYDAGITIVFPLLAPAPATLQRLWD